MLEAFKQLVENGVLSEQVRTEIESAFAQKIQENRDQVTTQLREEFAQRYEHDKGVLVEAIKDQQKQMDAMQRKIAELEAKKGKNV